MPLGSLVARPATEELDVVARGSLVEEDVAQLLGHLPQRIRITGRHNGAPRVEETKCSAEPERLLDIDGDPPQVRSRRGETSPAIRTYGRPARAPRPDRPRGALGGACRWLATSLVSAQLDRRGRASGSRPGSGTRPRSGRRAAAPHGVFRPACQSRRGRPTA